MASMLSADFRMFSTIKPLLESCAKFMDFCSKHLQTGTCFSPNVSSSSGFFFFSFFPGWFSWHIQSSGLTYSNLTSLGLFSMKFVYICHFICSIIDPFFNLLDKICNVNLLFLVFGSDILSRKRFGNIEFPYNCFLFMITLRTCTKCKSFSYIFGEINICVYL